MNLRDGKSEDSDQLGLSAEELSAFAERTGLEDVEQTALMAFALLIAEECAEIGDLYSQNGRNCGDDIRTRFGLG